MENCTLMAAARKIDYRWPLLDVRLVRLWLSIPSEENYHRGMGRYLHRQAVDGVAPKLVAWKQSKYMGNIIGRDFGGQMHISPDFVENIHPALKELVDMEKLVNQVENFAACKNVRQDGQTFQCRRNLQAVKELDYWLTQGHPNASFSS